MIFVAEDNVNGNEFTIHIPSDYAYYERGWAEWSWNFHLDGVALPADYSYGYFTYGTISAAQLLPPVTHTIAVDNYGVLVIVYRVP